MNEILFLAHRIPYPPNKGDKIRAFNILKWLSARYRVHLGAFVDDQDDWRHVESIKELCAEICLRPLNPGMARLRSLKGLLHGEPLTFPYYRDQVMGQWVNHLLDERPLRAVVSYSACMAQYVSGLDRARRIIDFVDLDSDKWRQFAKTRAWPWSWLYRREARTLAKSEARIASDFDASVFVSRAEAALFRQNCPMAAARVSVINNGVDTGFFSPRQRGANPYARETNVLVFTGAMDYWPNVDAVTWFAREIFPLVRKHIADAKFYIVGASPTRSILALAKQPGVRVTGKVSDVRPYVGHAKAAVAPLRIARGVQNKVLEALAMAKPVLMTQAARAGLEDDPALASLVADNAQELAERAIALLTQPQSSAVVEQYRSYVQRHYDWARNLEGLNALLEQPVESRDAMAIAV